MTKEKNLSIKLIRSVAGRLPAHKATVLSLGLRRMHQIVKVKDTPSVKGMIKQVGYLLKVENI